ncbi:MAG: tetratricopeptide repeat protein [Bacteroidales bacterium]|nr:tetratricopeptide repeat protein [Bacteroidales bacterium]
MEYFIEHMKKAILTIIILYIFSNTHLQQVLAQEQRVIDSLLNCLDNAIEDSNKVNLLIHLGSGYKNSIPEKAIDYSTQALNLAIKLGYNKGIMRSYQTIGTTYIKQGNYDIAINYIEKAMEIAEKTDDKSGISACLGNIGVIYEIKGNYEKALEFYEESLKMDEKIGDRKGIADCFNNMGIIYDYQGNFDKADEYYNKSLEMYKEIGNKEGISMAYGNLGTLYNQKGDYGEAIDLLNKALEINQDIGNINGISLCLFNIGLIYIKQENPDKAIEYYERSLVKAEELEDKKSISEISNNIAEVYINQGNYQKALEYLQKALDISNEIGDKATKAISVNIFGQLLLKQDRYYEAIAKLKEALKLFHELGVQEGISLVYINIGQAQLQLNNYSNAIENCLKGLEIAKNTGVKANIKLASEILAKSYAQQKDFEKAYQYYVLFKETHDSLFTMESQKQIAKIENNLELERKKTEIAEKDLKIMQQKSHQNMLIVGFVVFVIVLILVFFLLRINQQKKLHKLREALYMNMQKALSQQMNPHFIFNTLNSIQNYIHKNKVEESMKYLAKFADLMRKILYYSQNYTAPLKDEIELLEIYSQLESLRFKYPFNFELEIDKGIDSNTFNIPVFLLQPLIENAIKHGLEPLQGNGLIRLRIIKDEVGIICRVEDNGIGRYNVLEGTEKEGHKSIATNVIQNRLTILSKYYKKKFQFHLDDLKSETGEIIGAVSEITIPVI